VTDEHLQARVKRIEADVHALYRMTSMRDGKEIRAKIAATFGDDPRACIILRGVQKGLSGPKIAKALADRGLPQPAFQRVSETLKEMDEAGFVTKTEKGHYTAAGGLQGFGLDRTINATLKKKNVPDLD
jgi:hypothetical protein